MKIPEMYEEEIEYFGFIPYCFTKDLQESLEEGLKEILPENENNNEIHSEFKKNCFVMANFINRNVLKFPTGFKFERILSDKVINKDLKSELKKINKLKKQKLALNEEEKSLAKEYLRLKNYNNGFKNLLKYKDNYNELIEGVKELKEMLVSTESKCNSLIQFKPKTEDGKEFNKLLEHKDLENEYYRSEYKKLNEIGTLDDLEFIKHSLNE